MADVSTMKRGGIPRGGVPVLVLLLAAASAAAVSAQASWVRGPRPIIFGASSDPDAATSAAVSRRQLEQRLPPNEGEDSGDVVPVKREAKLLEDSSDVGLTHTTTERKLLDAAASEHTVASAAALPRRQLEQRLPPKESDSDDLPAVKKVYKILKEDSGAGPAHEAERKLMGAAAEESAATSAAVQHRMLAGRRRDKRSKNGDKNRGHKNKGRSGSTSSASSRSSSSSSGGKTSAAVALGSYKPDGKIRYLGGPLMTEPIDVYLIYYGNWKKTSNAAKDSGQHVLRSFVKSFSKTSEVKQWWALAAQFKDKHGRPVSNQVRLAGEYYDTKYSQGKGLEDDVGQIFQVITRQFEDKGLPVKSTAQYVVLTSPDVHVGTSPSAFCVSYCAWHFYKKYTPKGSSHSMPIYYSFVGNGVEQCPKLCPQHFPYPGPNDAPPGVHGMVALLAHEMAETATNPNTRTGWITDSGPSGEEGADMCASFYGKYKRATWQSPTGQTSGSYNLKGADGTRFLVQSLLDVKRGVCVMGL